MSLLSSVRKAAKWIKLSWLGNSFEEIIFCSGKCSDLYNTLCRVSYEKLNEYRETLLIYNIIHYVYFRFTFLKRLFIEITIVQLDRNINKETTILQSQYFNNQSWFSRQFFKQTVFLYQPVTDSIFKNLQAIPERLTNRKGDIGISRISKGILREPLGKLARPNSQL